MLDRLVAARPAARDAGSGVEQGFPALRVRGQVAPRRSLDLESRAWLDRLRAVEPVRSAAIGELHERLRREALFHIRRRARSLHELSGGDLEDLAVQAANDSLLAVLRKLDDYRGDSQFWTWARRFAQLEAPVSIRRRMGRERVAWGDPDWASEPRDPGPTPHERAEARELMETVSALIAEKLTRRQRAVLIAITVKGVSPRALAADLETTPGAIYKTLHDARAKLHAQLALC